MQLTKKNVVIASPFLIIAVNFGVAYIFGGIIGKWAFIPMVLVGWVLWLFFILKYGGVDSIQKWLKKSTGAFSWNLLAIIVGLIPLPLFLWHYELLDTWQVWLPWILLAWTSAGLHEKLA